MLQYMYMYQYPGYRLDALKNKASDASQRRCHC
eukprot:COSAG05_NODE_485_length_9349_cov_60.192865_11_plen_33_part_00